MKNPYVIILLAIIILFSGCIVGKPPAENVSEPEVENTTPIAVETPNESAQVPENVTPAEKTYSLVDEKVVSPGTNAALAVYGGKLWIAYSRFMGSNEDLYVKSFDGKSFGTDFLLAGNNDFDDFQPSAITYLGNLYVFFTQTVPRSQSATIYYRTYEGTSWNSVKPVPELESLFYYHNSSPVVYNGNLYLFWTKGKPTDYGFISSRMLKKDYWLDGITMTVTTGITIAVDDRNPKATPSGKDFFVMYENFAPNGEMNNVYVKRYSDGFWGTGVKLTGESGSSFKSSGSIYSFNGKLYAVWIEHGKLYLRISADGLAWDKTIELTKGDSQEDEPALMEYNGILYLAFTRYRENAPSVYLAKLDV